MESLQGMNATNGDVVVFQIGFVTLQTMGQATRKTTTVYIVLAMMAGLAKSFLGQEK